MENKLPEPLAAHEQWLKAYVAAKVASANIDPEPLLLKYKHTGNVLKNACLIAEAENFAKPMARAARLAALYHDLSRFDQYLQYGTFKDRDSRNHGAWSVKLAKMEGRLAGESSEIKRMALISIGLHNRLALPPTVIGETRIVCNAVRDADKLDILRVMDEHLSSGKPYNPTVILGLPDLPDQAGPAVIAAALNGRSASYTDLVSVNDFRLLLGTWLFSLNFASSREMFKKSGHARRLVAGIPDNGVYRKARRKILADLD